MAESGNIYLNILKVRKALVFDIGGLFIRMFSAQVVLGIVSMLTLCGWSFLLAGSVSSIVAISTFLIAPRVSQAADQRGQSHVVPSATLIALAGLGIMLVDLGLDGPFWLCYPAAVLMGFCPNAQSLTRARWTYMLETGMLDDSITDLKAIYAYEGVLDDASFMFGPSIAIALASLAFPVAGMAFGGIMLLAGTILMMIPHSTEPVPGWAPLDADESELAEKTPDKKRSMFLTSSLVRSLFAVVVCLGFFYSTHDTVIVAVGEEANAAGIVSIILFVASALSMVCGLIFGALKLRASLPNQMLVLAICYGLAYGCMFFINGIPMMMVVCICSAVFYGPLIITLNTMCERGVPSTRLTESLTWVNSGYTCGSAIAPIVAGLTVDAFGGFACLKVAGIIALTVLVSGIVTQPVVRKYLK